MIQEKDTVSLDLAAHDQNGEEVSFKSILGDNDYLVVYFYPKDDTPGCTTQACGFRDFNTNILSLGASIVGISKDSSASHKKFEEKYSLSFPLLADEDKMIHEKFGTWVEKSMYGKKYMGTQRATFLLDKEGTILHCWPKVKPKGHAEDVLAVLQEIKG